MPSCLLTTTPSPPHVINFTFFYEMMPGVFKILAEDKLSFNYFAPTYAICSYVFFFFEKENHWCIVMCKSDMFWPLTDVSQTLRCQNEFTYSCLRLSNITGSNVWAPPTGRTGGAVQQHAAFRPCDGALVSFFGGPNTNTICKHMRKSVFVLMKGLAILWYFCWFSHDFVAFESSPAEQQKSNSQVWINIKYGQSILLNAPPAMPSLSLSSTLSTEFR